MFWARLRHPHAQQPGGPEHQYQDQDAEDHHIGPLLTALEVAADEVDDDADNESTERGPHHIPDAAEDRGGEGDQAVAESEAEIDRLVIEAVDDAAGCRQRGADEEGDGDGPVDVDTHQARGIAILGRRPHRPAHAGALDELVERDHQSERDQDDEDVADANRGKPKVEAAAGQQVGIRDLVGPLQQEQDPLEDE